MNKIIRVIKLPTTIRGVTVPDSDGNYNIYINKNISHDMQIKTLIHESEHIKNDDFSNPEQVTVLEGKVKYCLDEKRRV